MAIEDELYQDVIVEYYRSRQFRGRLAGTGVYSAVGDNPSCGDRLELFARYADSHLVELLFEGGGCAICCATASMLCELLADETVDSARAVMERFRAMLVDEGSHAFPPGFEDFAALRGVRKFPMRIKCALLPWEAFCGILHALAKSGEYAPLEIQ